MQKHDNGDAARRQANEAAVRRLALENKLGWVQVCLMEDLRQGGAKQAYWEHEMKKVEKELGKLCTPICARLREEKHSILT